MQIIKQAILLAPYLEKFIAIIGTYDYDLTGA